MDNSEERMKILQIVGEIDGGGVASVVLNYLKCIDVKKIKVHILALKKDDKKQQLMQKDFEELGCKIIYIEHRNKGYIRHFKMFKKILEHEKYDIVHCHFGIWSMPYLVIAKQLGIKCRIAHSHVTMSEYSKKKNIILAFFKPILRNVTTHKFACGKDAGEYLWGKHSKFYIMRNAIDTCRFKYSEVIRNEIRDELNIKRNEIVIGHIGRFSNQKNHEFIIDLAQSLRDSGQMNIKFVLVGDGEKFEKIKTQVKEMRLDSKICLLGLRDDVERIMQSFDIFILPSFYEGFPVVGVEAQSNGLPVLFSDLITKEVKLLDSTEYLTVNDDLSIEIWGKEIKKIISKLNSADRENKDDIVKKLGYDIKIESRKLGKFYENIIK